MDDTALTAGCDELVTLRDLIRYAVSHFASAGLFYGHGSDNAWDEAIYLALHTLHLEAEHLACFLDARLTRAEREQLLDVYRRRVCERVPAAYLTKQAWFAGLNFYVDERVLIPRSPLAELIENAFQPWIDADNVQQVLELGTGSGCIAIACAYAFESAQVDAVDISEAALTVATINVQNHGLTDRVHLLKSDLFSELPNKQYDLIVSNPPYVDQVDMSQLPDEYQHEPTTLALASGQDGLDCVRQILLQAADYLTPHGVLVVEVGNSEAALSEAFPDAPFTWLEFERGGEGVFLLTKQELAYFAAHAGDDNAG